MQAEEPQDISQPVIFDNPDDVRARLFAMGIDYETFVNCIMDGVIARAACTENHPPSFHGTTMWGQITAALRTRFAPAGWTKSDSANFSVVFNAGRTFSIVVATGDRGVGRRNTTPHTKYPKGTCTIDAVNVNADQLDLFDPSEPIPVVRPKATNPLTYMLLVNHEGLSGVYAELSLPLVIDEDGHIVKWRERIILGRVAGGDGGDHGVRRREPETGPDIDVAVTRRVA